MKVQKRRPKTEEQKEKDRLKHYERYHEILKFDLEHKSKSTKNTRRWQLKHPEKYMWGRSKQASIKLNLPFNIEIEDIKIPKICPVLKVPLVVGTRYTPSLDRIIPQLGYVKGNIQIISMKANTMKTDATFEELKLFAKWVNEYIK